jgi:hypothetical protein
MKNLTLNQDERVIQKLSAYPDNIRPKIAYLRSLILEVAEASESITEIEETLKWGEPSYLTKKGSTIRIDWKTKTPDRYAVYFKCTSKLVETFREVYGDLFNYENNRAIVFTLHDEVPEEELKQCIERALIYHTVKNLPGLGLQAPLRPHCS